MLKKKPQDGELMVASLKVFPHRADDYLPIIASMDITNNEIWLALASLAIKEENYSMAETYLNNSRFSFLTFHKKFYRLYFFWARFL